MTDIALSELVERLGEVTVLDVRRREEYDGMLGNACDPRQGHIPGAVHFRVEEMVLYSDEELRDKLGLPEGAEIVAYCHSGSRSAAAVQILRGVGYDARNYSGSWHEWSRTELPLEGSHSNSSESTHPE
jgi:thiosulfate/3-mercaptopyruvate sulfurtransferase